MCTWSDIRPEHQTVSQFQPTGGQETWRWKFSCAMDKISTLIKHPCSMMLPPPRLIVQGLSNSDGKC